MAPPTLLARGSCRNGHVIASEDDLVESGRQRQCRECRYEDDAAIARRELASQRFSREWHDWTSGKRQTRPAPPR